MFQGHTISTNMLILVSVLMLVWGSFGLMYYYIGPQLHFPRLYRLLLIVAILYTILQAISSLIPSLLFHPLNTLTDSTVMAYILLSAVLQILIAAKGSIQARLFLLSTLPYLVAVLYQTFATLYYVRAGNAAIATQMAMAFQVLLFSVAIGYRISAIRKDKELAQAQALHAFCLLYTSPSPRD